MIEFTCERRKCNLEIIVGKTAGFCYGVNNAVTKAEEFVKNNKDKKVYCLGELVHNRQVTSKLEKEGLVFIDDLIEIVNLRQMQEEKNKEYNSILKENDENLRKYNNLNEETSTAVIIRAHGEPKSTYEELKQNNIEILDLTCPNVLAIHKLVEEYILKGYYVFLIGQKDHPETIGTYGFGDGKCTVIENEDDIDIALNELIQKNMNKIFVVSQTTFSMEKFEKYVGKIEDKINNFNEQVMKQDKNTRISLYKLEDEKAGQYKKEQLVESNRKCNLIELEIKNTICNATRIRQEETEKISKQVDSMIIIGGKNSSNTRKLYDIAKKNCENTVIIETCKEFEKESLNGTNSMQKNNAEKDANKRFLEKSKTSNKIGIMAGASTPQESIEEVIDFLSYRKLHFL